MTPKPPPITFHGGPLSAEHIATMRAHDPLRTRAEAHDRYNLELKIASRLPPEEAQKSEGALRYHIDLYLFFPLSFGVGAETYPATRLFHDLKSYLRREPPMLWRSNEDDTLDPGPLIVLERSLEALVKGGHPQPADQAKWMHFFGCALRRSIRHMSSVFPPQVVEDPDLWDDGQWLQALKRFEARLKSLCDLLTRFRAIREQLWMLPDLVHLTYDEAALVADEMASYLLESVLADVDIVLQGLVSRSGWSVALLDQVGRARRDLVLTARAEMSYRLRLGFLKHQAATQTREEYFTYRVGQLKKLMDRVLFFDVEQYEAPTPWRHVVAGVGAALAATWAFVAGASTGGMAQNSGTSTFVVFCVAVVAYILKDRIKEISREKLMGWLRKHRPDRTARFGGDHVQFSDRTRLDGEVHETVSFRAPEALPSVVRTIRDAGHVVAVDERVERVLHYSRRVQYTLQGGDPFQFEVKDILRLNIRPFLDHLDVPDRTVRYFDPTCGQFNATSAMKVYHMNVALVYRVLNPTLGASPGADEGWTTYERLRVILTRHGIERVEAVLPRGEHPWLMESQHHDAYEEEEEGLGLTLSLATLSPDAGPAPARPPQPIARPQPTDAQQVQRP